MRKNQITLKLTNMKLLSNEEEGSYKRSDFSVYADSNDLFSALKMSLESLYLEMKEYEKFKEYGCDSFEQFLAKIVNASKQEYVASSITSTRLDFDNVEIPFKDKYKSIYEYGKPEDFDLKPEELKITGWTDWDNPNYIDIDDSRIGHMSNLEKAMYDLIVKELQDKGYQFTGSSHQEYKKGTPVFNDKYKFCCSCRQWGEIMATAKGANLEEDFMAYVEWAWTPPIKGMDENGDCIFEDEILPD